MIRPRRSALYLPGSNRRAAEKARSLPCDILIFDLEDAVAPEAKHEARSFLRSALRNPQAGVDYGARELVVRINGFETPWYADDLKAVAEICPDAVLLPKAESAEHVTKLADDLIAAGAPDSIRIWCMMETPKAILNSAMIAASHSRLECLVLGTSDLTQDLHALHTALRLPMQTSLGLCLLAARAYDLAILDGVALDLSDEAAFRAVCLQGRELGFDGKTLVHPKQIIDCNEAFSPSANDVTQAQNVVDAFAAARAAGQGVATLNGRLIEGLHVREAERVLALHKAITTKN